jgi:hypothetical protein
MDVTFTLKIYKVFVRTAQNTNTEKCIDNYMEGASKDTQTFIYLVTAGNQQPSVSY